MNKECNIYYIDNELYIVDDSEIKKGDYTIYCSTWLCKILKHYGDQVQVLKIADNIITTVLIPKHKKIIATTDSLLVTVKDSYLGKVRDYLPQIPKQFIEYYINEFNASRKITKVLVEFEEHYDIHYYTPAGGIECAEKYNDYLKLKLSSTNEIFIKPVEEKMYSRDEVKEIAESAYHFGRLNSTISMPKFDNWLKENLK